VAAYDSASSKTGVVSCVAKLTLGFRCQHCLNNLVIDHVWWLELDQQAWCGDGVWGGGERPRVCVWGGGAKQALLEE
jgi:hypothetical protein